MGENPVFSYCGQTRSADCPWPQHHQPSKTTHKRSSHFGSKPYQPPRYAGVNEPVSPVAIASRTSGCSGRLLLKNKWIAWFSTHCLDIIPIERDGKVAREELFQGCYQALENQQIIVFFPEGTRSLTEEREFKLKRGIHHLVQQYPDTIVVPIILRGLGKALPKGEALLVPFNCDVIVGEPIAQHDDADAYLANLTAQYEALLTQCITR